MTKNIFSGILVMITLFGAFSTFAQDQAKIDDKILQDYFAKNKIKPMKTSSGLYYTINRKGTGENVKAGKAVKMYYYGKLLDGKRFDGNMDENYQPVSAGRTLDFNIGVGQVIKGWDEGVLLMNKGSRATFYIPSGLGYGPGGRGPIPPNGIMIFDVELVDFAN
jgi:FKBP-type peptidyl-prolyl cis-trans isomerase FkpA